MSSRFLLSMLAQAVLAIALPCARAWADCPIPSTVGIVICQPSPGATIYQLPHFEAAANPASGSITDIKVFIDGRFDFDNPGPVLSLIEGAVNTNGEHTILLDATDSSGRHYGVQESFSVIGDFPATCPIVGLSLRICSPQPGEVISQNLAFMVGFRGKTAISLVRVYVDGSALVDISPPFSGNGAQLIAGVGPVSAGTHLLTLVAWDTLGDHYKSSAPFVAFYDIGCPPKGNQCFPVLQVNTPQDGQDVTSPFRVSAEVQFNSIPVSAIKAYLDGRQVGESFGPFFDQPINATKGTHILELQGWDTEGKLYRVTENVNVR